MTTVRRRRVLDVCWNKVYNTIWASEFSFFQYRSNRRLEGLGLTSLIKLFSSSNNFMKATLLSFFNSSEDAAPFKKLDLSSSAFK